MAEETPSRNNEVIRYVEPDENLKRIFGKDAEVTMSFDPRTPEGAELLFIATLDKLTRLSDMAGETIYVRDIFAHPAEREDDKGEVTRFIRSVIITPDKKAYDCGSEGVRKTIVLLRSVRGTPPWDPPIRVKVIRQQTRAGRNWMFLRPDASHLFANVTTPNNAPKKE